MKIVNRAPSNEINTDLMFFNYTWSGSGHKDKEWDSKLTGKKKGPRHRGTIKQKIPCKLPGPFTGSSQLKAGSNRANSNSLTHLGYNLVICNIYSSIAHNSQKGCPSTHVPVNWWTDKQNVVYVYNAVLLSHEKEWNSGTGYKTDEPWKHYAMK